VATTTLCQPATTTTFAKRVFRCSSPAVWNSLPKTVVTSDSVTVFKSRLKTFLFSRAFSLSLLSVAHCLAPAPMKLRPYGAIQICLLLLLFSFIPQVVKIPGLKTTTAKIKMSDGIIITVHIRFLHTVHLNVNRLHTVWTPSEYSVKR